MSRFVSKVLRVCSLLLFQFFYVASIKHQSDYARLFLSWTPTALTVEILAEFQRTFVSHSRHQPRHWPNRHQPVIRFTRHEVFRCFPSTSDSTETVVVIAVMKSRSELNAWTMNKPVHFHTARGRFELNTWWNGNPRANRSTRYI